ncbi:MAG: hypothetical protein HY211_07840 [Candidatus Omnitrophica bacterium]|nr:hypothetical protein [Candidatus Omnitrophota bacterium]
MSPAFLAYEQRLKQRINSEGVFQVELDERGLLQKLILRGTEVLYDAEAEFSSSGEFKFSYGQIMPLRLLVYTAEDGLLTMHAEQGAFFHYHADSSRRALELEVGVDVTEDNRQLLREMMDNIAAAGGAAEIEFQGPTLPNMSEILEQQVQIELVDGQGRWRIVGGQNGWIVSNLPPAAGMEERNVEGALAALAEGAQGAGVVVIGPEGLEVRAGLEEMVKRAPPELLHRMVFFAVGAVWAERLRQLNRGVRVIEKDDLNALIPILLAMPEADRVAVLGWLALAQRLERVVPPSITVSFLDMNAAFRLILAAMGVPAALLDQIDAVGLEEQLARRRSA